MKNFVFIWIAMMIENTLFKGKEEVFLWKDVGNPNQEKVKLYVCEPEANIKNGTCVIICPGGSYHHLGMTHEGFYVADWLNSQGITAFVLKYRVSQFGWHHPAMIEDLQKAIQYVRQNASKYGVNPESVGVMGFSAGGHLVGTASLYYDENYIGNTESDVSLRPDFTVMVYPVVSMQDSIAHQRSKKNLLGKAKDKDLEDKMSLEANVHQGIPPVLLIHAKDDDVVDYRNSFYLNENMKKAGVDVEYLLYENGGHGFGAGKTKKYTPPWQADCLEWLHKKNILK
ncbi:MAG TPA: alpha/beta hydrolase [Prolixibacteraceae bacterium]|nr:alpha/beta hydrolase [Prolixibacteraceae bacterium]